MLSYLNLGRNDSRAQAVEKTPALTPRLLFLSSSSSAGLAVRLVEVASQPTRLGQGEPHARPSYTS